MRVGQLWNWLYVQGATDFARMTNIAKEFRAELEGNFTLARPEIVTEQVSSDGTRKWLLRLDDGKEVETVYIPEEDRGTLCISSQVGCTLTCSFCHTGTQKLVRNLDALRDRRPDHGCARPPRRLARCCQPKTRAASPTPTARSPMSCSWAWASRSTISIMCATPWRSPPTARASRVSKRRITLSTSGIVPEIPRWGEEAGTMLAISLHAVRDDLRNELVPINKKWPIKDLLDACRAYPGLSNAKRITFEYVMLKGVNDSIADAKELVRLLAKIPAKINLIPFNPWPGAPYECSDWEQIEKFGEVVNRAGYASPVRSPRGRDIMAACGQLKSASIKQRASERRYRPSTKSCTDSSCPTLCRASTNFCVMSKTWMAGTSPAMTNIECQEWALAPASAASSRSLPQNSSSPMVKDGAPNSPRDAASSV